MALAKARDIFKSISFIVHSWTLVLRVVFQNSKAKAVIKEGNKQFFIVSLVDTRE